MSISEAFDRPIAFQRAFVEFGCGITGALLLSQAIYWSKRTTKAGRWFYKTQSEWTEETGMSRAEQETARRSLRTLGVLEEKRVGIPAKLHYRVNFDRIDALLLDQFESIDVESFVQLNGNHLLSLSKTALMRAKKLGLDCELVDYRQVLLKKGMICGICGKPIKQSTGKHKLSLAFDHIKALDNGGAHVFNNIQPAHHACNAAKSNKDALPKQTGLLSESALDGFDETDSTALPRQTITESTTEITTETTSDISVSKPKKRFTPPSRNEVLDHMLTKHLPFDLAEVESEKFINFYESKGWLVGKTKMKNWKAAASNWVARCQAEKKTGNHQSKQSHFDYSIDQASRLFGGQ